MKITIRVALVALLLYLAVIGGMVWKQRDFIYRPTLGSSATPSDFGLTYDDIRIKAKDGAELHAWWLAQPPELTAPTLLYCHGNGGDLSRYPHVTKIFHDYGWNLLIFDYRGYGKSSAIEINEEALVRDATSAYDWLLSRNIPENQIVIWGHSLGTAIASKLATERNPAALILENALPSTFAMARFMYPWLLVPRALLWDRLEIIQNVQNRHMPLLMVHAAEDVKIPPELGRGVFDAAAQPKEWLLIPGIGHTGFPSVQERYREQLTHFVARHTGTIAR